MHPEQQKALDIDPGTLMVEGEKSQVKVVRLRGRRLSSAEIVAGLLENNPVAIEALYDQFGKKINRLILRMMGPDAEHDDVVHQVFINVLSSIKKLKNTDAIGDWIIGVTVNTVRRELRSRKYRRTVIPSAQYPEQVAHGCEPDKQVLIRRVVSILKELKVDDHIVFVLRFVEGNTLGEVATAGGYSLATAKRRIARAKKEFAKRAQNDPILASLMEDLSHG